jgi:hypothetical protein
MPFIGGVHKKTARQHHLEGTNHIHYFHEASEAG